jgi:hypothetical protein
MLVCALTLWRERQATAILTWLAQATAILTSAGAGDGLGEGDRALGRRFGRRSRPCGEGAPAGEGSGDRAPAGEDALVVPSDELDSG